MHVRFDHYHHFDPSPLGQTLKDVLSELQALRRETMATLKQMQDAVNELKTDVANETAVDQSVLVLLQGQATELAAIKQQLADAVASGDPAAIQSSIDDLTNLHTTMTANAASLAAAVAANTVADPNAPASTDTPSDPTTGSGTGSGD